MLMRSFKKSSKKEISKYLFLNKKRLLIFMCVLFFSVPGCRNGEEGNPFEGCPYSFLGVKLKTAGYGKLTRGKVDVE